MFDLNTTITLNTTFLNNLIGTYKNDFKYGRGRMKSWSTTLYKTFHLKGMRIDYTFLL